MRSPSGRSLRAPGGRLADRHGQRTVSLVFPLANALAVAALVRAALGRLPVVPPALLGALAGASVPVIGPPARARVVGLLRLAAGRTRPRLPAPIRCRHLEPA